MISLNNMAKSFSASSNQLTFASPPPTSSNALPCPQSSKSALFPSVHPSSTTISSSPPVVIRRARHAPTMVLAVPSTQSVKSARSTTTANKPRPPPSEASRETLSKQVKSSSSSSPPAYSVSTYNDNNKDLGLIGYLKEIGSVNLLEGHEVVECARHIRNLLEWERIRLELHVEKTNPPPVSENIDSVIPSIIPPPSTSPALSSPSSGIATLESMALNSPPSLSTLPQPTWSPDSNPLTNAINGNEKADTSSLSLAKIESNQRFGRRATVDKMRYVKCDIEVEEWAKAVGMDVKEFERQLAIARSYKDRLVSANLRLVVSIAKKYMYNGVTLADLIQEGSLGLIRGAEKFDHTKGFRFATYVSWWIRQAIQRAICDSSRNIRLPTHVSDMAKRALRIRRQMEFEFNRPPTTREIAERLGIKEERLNFVLSKEQQTSTISLDVPLRNNSSSSSGGNSGSGGSKGDQKTMSLGDLIENPYESPEEAVSAALLRDDIENVLLMLSPREREVLRLRYGFDDGRGKNFEEIAAIYCVPPNRIRQIEAKAIRKLRHPNFHRCLNDWRGY